MAENNVKDSTQETNQDPRLRYVSNIRQKYNSPTPGELPLIAVGSSSLSNQEQFLELIKECGFKCFQSTFNPHSGSPSLEAYFNLSEKHHVKQIVRLYERPSTTLNCNGLTPGSKEELEHHLTETNTKVVHEDKTVTGYSSIEEWNTFIDAWNETVKKVWNHEACAGYQLSDEPAITKLGWLSYVKDTIIENDPLQGMAFVNLLPEWAERQENIQGLAGGCENHYYIPSTGEAKLEKVSYQAYLDEYQKMFKPAVWLYDGYFASGGTYTPLPDKEVHRNDTFFTNLELIRKKAIEDDRPFWATVRCLYKNNLKFDGTDETDKYQIYQFDIPESYSGIIAKVVGIECFCYLAYGAKGLLFWSLISRPGKFAWAPIQRAVTETFTSVNTLTVTYGGNSEDTVSENLFKTTLFDKLKGFVEQIRKVEQLFLKSHVCRIEALNVDARFGIVELKTYPFGPISSTSTSGFTPAGKDALSEFVVAHHRTLTGEFVVFVNISAINKSQLTVYSSYRLKEMITETYMSPQTGGARYKLTTTVEPGAWRIFYRDF